MSRDEELAGRIANIMGPSSAAAACLRKAADLRAHGTTVEIVLQGNVWTLMTAPARGKSVERAGDGLKSGAAGQD